MEPESSLPQAQMPATCPYPEPTRYSPYTHSYILKIHLNIILPSTPESPQRSPFLTFPHQKTVYNFPLTHKCYMPRPSHSSRFYHLKSIGWGEQIIQLLIMQLPPLLSYLVSPKPKYSPQHPILKHPQCTFLPQCERPRFTPIQNNRRNYSFVYLNL